MRTTKPTSKQFLRRATLAPLLAALGLLALGTGVAAGQSGGVGAGGGGTEPPPPPPSEPSPPPSTGSKQFFPVKGKHTYGDGFGAARSGHSHQGVDIFAACGQSAVAVMNGTVVLQRLPGLGGQLHGDPQQEDPPRLRLHAPAQARPAQGHQGGRSASGSAGVGDTGNASGCHLHFEIWKGKWYRGGRPIDPLASLQAWDAYS